MRLSKGWIGNSVGCRMTRRRLISSGVLLACVMLCGSAKALPPAQALYGTINAQTVAIFAENSSMGTCLRGEVQRGTDWQPIFSLECGIDQGKLDAHGGAKGYIQYLLPDINLRLNAFFSGGTGVEGQLDEALNVGFKFVGTSLVVK